MQEILRTSIELALNSLVLSGVFLSVALGLNIIFALGRVINLSHGSLYALGAYFGCTLIGSGLNFFMALILSPILVGLVGLLIERGTISHVRKRDIHYTLILTYGLWFFLDGSIRYFWGSGNYFTKLPESLHCTLTFAGIKYPLFRIVILILTAIVLAGLMLLLGKTKIGLALRAASNIPEMVSCLGINMKVVHVGAFVLGSVLAGIAGFLAGPLFTIHPEMGHTMLINSFVVVVIGGLGSLRGSAVSALLIGIVQSFSEFFFADLAMVVVYITMAFILAFMPRGLLGEGRHD
jgi:branched-subunit amino acid ABC-type transport system permease component